MQLEPAAADDSPRRSRPREAGAAQQVTKELLQNLIRDELASVEAELHRDTRAIHAELVKQFYQQNVCPSAPSLLIPSAPSRCSALFPVPLASSSLALVLVVALQTYLKEFIERQNQVIGSLTAKVDELTKEVETLRQLSGCF
jgi:hypothetical protein